MDHKPKCVFKGKKRKIMPSDIPHQPFCTFLPTQHMWIGKKNYLVSSTNSLHRV